MTTPALLAAVLPDVDAARCFAWLCEHPSAEPLGDGVTLHDLVGRAMRADLRAREPELERDLRRRLVDALYARGAGDGLLRLTLDLQHLVQDPAIRWGFAWDPSGSCASTGHVLATQTRSPPAAVARPACGWPTRGAGSTRRPSA